MTKIQLNKKLLLASALVLSWAALLWINFFAELSMAMHLMAIPFLLIITTGFVAWHIEHDSGGNTADLCS